MNQEIHFDKYEKYGDYHWDEYKRQTAYGKHANFVRDWVQLGLTLDVGAGDGLITSLLHNRKNSYCFGVDDNELATKLAIEKDVHAYIGSAYKLPFDSDRFDSVYMGDVIEHLQEPRKALQEAKRVLKPTGILYLVTPPALANGQMQDPLHYFEWTATEMQMVLLEEGFAQLSICTKPKFVRMYASYKKITPKTN